MLFAHTFKKLDNPLSLTLVYLLIVLQGFFTVSLIPIIFGINLITNIEPSYLLLWGAVRLMIILPLIFWLYTKNGPSVKKIFYNQKNFHRTLQIAFWSTLLFILLGFLFYPYFLNQPTITLERFFSYFPYFILFSVSNSFVEELFFRGLLLNKLTERFGPEVGNNLQALAFALIHLVVLPFNPNATLFVMLTFVLGYVWGWLTLKTKSLLPAIIFHTVADIFLVVSLF